MKKTFHSVTSQVYAALRPYKSFLLLLLAFTVLRGLSILLLRPGGFFNDNGPDQKFYLRLARWAGGGKIAFFDFWMEYPPLMPWLAALAYRISLYIPPWSNGLLGFNLVFRFLLLPFEIGNLLLVWGIARQTTTPERADWVAALWALLFAPAFIFLAWFDSMAIFFLLLALYGLLTDRPILAGVAVGLGFMTKVIPAVFFPIGLFTLQTWRQRIIYAFSAAFSAGIVILPPLIVSPGYTLAFFQVMLNRSSWSTIWALLEGYAGCGEVSPLKSHLDLGAVNFERHPATLPWGLINLAFAGLYLFLVTRRIAWRDKRKMLAFACFSLLLFILYSKGYSPQWAPYIATMALIALPLARGLGYALVMDVILFSELAIGFWLLSGDESFLTGIILIRTVIFVCLTLESLAHALPAHRLWPGIARGALPVALLATVVGGGILSNQAWRAYVNDRLINDPLAPFVQLWRGVKAAKNEVMPVVVLQPDLQERLSPQLGPRYVQIFPHLAGTPFEDTTAWLTDFTAQHSTMWLLYDPEQEPLPALYAEMNTWLTTHAYLIEQQQYHAIQANHYCFLLKDQPVTGAQFVAPVRLMRASALPASLAPGASVCVRLTWVADALLDADYGMFFHLLAPSGELVAQADGWPQVPTHAWTVGADSFSVHVLNLPADLPPGDYTLTVGLYRIGENIPVPLTSGADFWPLRQVQVTSP